MKQLHPKWVENVSVAIDTAKRDGTTFARTLSEPLAKKALVTMLTNRGIPFTVHNMGCGVVRITTDTATCPCCGKPLAAKTVEIGTSKAGD